MSSAIRHAFAIIWLLLPAAVFADEDLQSNPLYGGFALGFASADSDCDSYGYNCDGEETSFKVYAGKRLHPNLAAEIAYYDLGTFRNKGFAATTTAETSGLNLSVLGIIPVSSYGFFYGRAGVMLWQADYQRIDANIVSSDEDGTDFTYGAGFAWQIDKQYDLRFEFERLHDLGNDFVPGGSGIDVFNIAGTIYFY